jgi:hypothetical protein
MAMPRSAHHSACAKSCDDLRDVDPAWRTAFRANPDHLNCTQLISLGINAHMSNDLAFMIEELGPRYTYPDHKHVDDVLAYRTRPVVPRDPARPMPRAVQ